MVDRPPRLAGVLSSEDPCRRNRAEHPVRVARVDQDGVQAKSAGARRPAGRGLVGPEARQLVPGLAGIARLEDGRVLDSRIDRVGIVQRGFQVPDALELVRMRRTVIPGVGAYLP